MNTQTATYIKKSTLEWLHLWENFGMRKDNGGRWYPSKETPKWVESYLDGYRSPSRNWPNSYATALLSQKFARLVCEKDAALAVKLGVAK